MKPVLICLMLFCFNLFQTVAIAEEGAPYYFEIEAPFTINFLRQSEQKARFLQVRVALRSQDTALIDNAQSHLPIIQDQLRILFSQQTLEVISTLQGREKLQQQAYEIINQIFATELNNPHLDAVFFTTFLWQ